MTSVAPPVHLFDTTFAVHRAAETQDASRSPILTYTSHLSGLKGRIQPMSGSEAVRYGRESTRSMWRVYTSPGKDIKAKDRVVFTDKTVGSNIERTLDIQEVKVAQLAGTVLRLICQETL